MMNDRASIARSCFASLLAIGFFLILMGVVLEPIKPWFALDRVLTPEELANPETRRATLTLLKRAQGYSWLFWTLAGVLVVSISGIGLWAAPRRRLQNSESRSYAESGPIPDGLLSNRVVAR